MSTHCTSRPFSRLLLITATAFGLAACSTPAPPAEPQLAVASAAVDNASRAGAAEWAPDDLRSAREKLAQARQAATANNDRLANSLAAEAEVDAQLAQAKVRSARSRKAAAEVTEANRVLREEMNRKTQ